METIKFEKRGHQAWITLNRPEAQNRLNGVMFVDRVNNAILLNQELKKHGFSAKAVKPVA